MKKAMLRKISVVLLIVLVAALISAACDSPPPRIPDKFFFNPGPFSTNVNDEDPRRQVRCTVVFEVVDEAAIEELSMISFIVRNSVLTVLGQLTIPEITTRRNLEAIGQRLIDQINEDIASHYDLVIGAFFTDFALV